MIVRVVEVQEVQEVQGEIVVVVIAVVVVAAPIIIKTSPLRAEASQPLPRPTNHFVNPRI
jgi:hypothetical protein